MDKDKQKIIQLYTCPVCHQEGCEPTGIVKLQINEVKMNLNMFECQNCETQFALVGGKYE